MNKCQFCGSENVKLVPAGFSVKKNKKYDAFYSCNECKKTFNPPQAKTAFIVPAPTPRVEALLEDMLEQLRAIRVLLEMKRDNLDPSDILL